MDALIIRDKMANSARAAITLSKGSSVHVKSEFRNALADGPPEASFEEDAAESAHGGSPTDHIPIYDEGEAGDSETPSGMLPPRGCDESWIYMGPPKRRNAVKYSAEEGARIKDLLSSQQKEEPLVE